MSSTNGYGLSETSEIINGLFKFIEIFKWVLQFEVNLCISWVMFPVLSLELMILLIFIFSPLLQVYVLLRLNFNTHSLMYCIFQTMVDPMTIPSQI